MRQLVPTVEETDPAKIHAQADRPAPQGRPWVAANMIVSIDGATAVDDVSGGLGGPADKEIFTALRAVADVILVAAGTARAEGYRAPRTAPDRRAARRERGQTPFPRLVLVTRSLELDPDAGLFTDFPEGPERPEQPLIYTVSSAPADRRAALDSVAELVDAGDQSVDLEVVLKDLGGRGVHLVLTEGGPGLIGQLLGASLLDEVNMTVAPMLAGGSSRRLAHGADETLTSMDLAHLWESDGYLLARYVRANA